MFAGMFVYELRKCHAIISVIKRELIEMEWAINRHILQEEWAINTGSVAMCYS